MLFVNVSSLYGSCVRSDDLHLMMNFITVSSECLTGNKSLTFAASITVDALVTGNNIQVYSAAATDVENDPVTYSMTSSSVFYIGQCKCCLNLSIVCLPVLAFSVCLGSCLGSCMPVCLYICP